MPNFYKRINALLPYFSEIRIDFLLKEDNWEDIDFILRHSVKTFILLYRNKINVFKEKDNIFARN